MTWTFPNGTGVPELNGFASVQQVDNVSLLHRRKELLLNSLVSSLISGSYRCEYFANNASRVKEVNITFTGTVMNNFFSYAHPYSGFFLQQIAK